MILDIEPKRFAELAKKGFQRTETYCKARLMFIKEFCGQYFKSTSGLTGETPINLLFTTMRAYVPNLVMASPVNLITTDIADFKDLAYSLGFSLNKLQKQLNQKSLLRALIVNAIFSIGIVETGLCVSDNLIMLEDADVDPGQIFTELVDLDDFVIDPYCTALDKPLFVGHLVRTRKSLLYEVNGLDRDLIAKLPPSNKTLDAKTVEYLSKKNTGDNDDIEDFVNIVKLWVPEANAVVYIPDPRTTISDKFIGVKDFYGPKTGPYTYLSFTPPIPKNPLPVAPIGIWLDLHNMVNRVAKKTLNQVDNQKDNTLYKPAYADVVQELEDAEDQENIACEDPSAIVKISTGGANETNVKMLNQLQMWFNLIAANPLMLEGATSDVATATQAQILQSNASVSIADMRDIISDCAAEISRVQGWYLLYDPFFNPPNIKRTTGGQEMPLELTPEMRRGAELDFWFKIKPRSMQIQDPSIRRKILIDLCTNVVPNACLAATAAMRAGVPFNLKRYLTAIFEEFDFADVMTDIFDDPEFQQKLQILLQAGPQNDILNLKAGIQNQGSPLQTNIPSGPKEQRQFAQNTAAESQANRTNLQV